MGLSMGKKKILVVDDEPQSVEMLKTRLETGGYEVFSACCGKEALEAVKKNKPDLILLDIILPDINGFQVCKAIKSNKATKDIKVIVCTNKLDEIHAMDARESEADEFIEKMLDSRMLLKLVGSFI
jgi:two-component system alkaline phosphatase synthesis response regulator PhoP